MSGIEVISGGSIGGWVLDILTVLWLFLPGYLSNSAAQLWGRAIPRMVGMEPIPIDGGRCLKDGYRILGDGKTWQGLIGGTFAGGVWGVVLHALASGNHDSGSRPFVDLLAGVDASSWFWLGNEWGAAFIIGLILGFGCLFGDSAGSFIKRRRGLKREGEISSESLILDTMPFAISTFVFGQLLLTDTLVGSAQVRPAMVMLLLLTPLIHRGVNKLGYRLKLKDVPY